MCTLQRLFLKNILATTLASVCAPPPLRACGLFCCRDVEEASSELVPAFGYASGQSPAIGDGDLKQSLLVTEVRAHGLLFVCPIPAAHDLVADAGSVVACCHPPIPTRCP